MRLSDDRSVYPSHSYHATVGDVAVICRVPTKVWMKNYILDQYLEENGVCKCGGKMKLVHDLTNDKTVFCVCSDGCGRGQTLRIEE